jgi:hypothetical protein
MKYNYTSRKKVIHRINMYLKDARDKNAVTALLIFTTSIK